MHNIGAQSLLQRITFQMSMQIQHLVNCLLLHFLSQTVEQVCSDSQFCLVQTLGVVKLLCLLTTLLTALAYVEDGVV